MNGVILIVAAIFLASCRGPSPPPTQSERAKPVVYVTNYPLKYFAARIGSDLIELHFPAPRDADPAYWEPDPATIEAFQKADLILLNGASYEKWMERTSMPLSNVTDTSAAFKDRFIPLAETVTHSHGPEGQHSHAGTAFTTWLDPMLATEQAKAIRTAIGRIVSDHADQLDRNFSGLVTDLSALDRELAAIQPATLLASHPVYQYLARRYKWNLQSVHWEPDEVPSETEWGKLQSLLRKHHAKLMLWEASPRPEIEARLKQLGITPVAFEPCANVPENGDYLTVMRENAGRLKQVLH